MMVVMERLGPEAGWHTYDAADVEQRTAALDAWQRGLRAAGYVHGDLRAANILVRQGEGRRSTEVRLLDFDWAGREGEARYPLTRNSDLPWAPGSEAGGVILAAHDEVVLLAGGGV
jgi:hypothetical protein